MKRIKRLLVHFERQELTCEAVRNAMNGKVIGAYRLMTNRLIRLTYLIEMAERCGASVEISHIESRAARVIKLIKNFRY